jgi:preprotein translocase subunit Sec63
VQFSREALERLELLKQQQAKETSQETQTTDEKDSELEDSLQILNLNKNATVQEIRKAYLTAIQYYHPDKHAYLPPEFRQLAEAKSKQINEVYNSLLKIKAGDQPDSKADQVIR